MQYPIKEGERILGENELRSISANERRTSYFPLNTEFDFTVDFQPIGYKSSNQKDLVKFADCLKNGKTSVVRASMLMRTPFNNADAIAKTDFQKQLNACQNAFDLYNLIKGKKFRVVEIVTVSEVHYGETEPRDEKYSVFDTI